MVNLDDTRRNRLAPFSDEITDGKRQSMSEEEVFEKSIITKPQSEKDIRSGKKDPKKSSFNKTPTSISRSIFAEHAEMGRRLVDKKRNTKVNKSSDFSLSRPHKPGFKHLDIKIKADSKSAQLCYGRGVKSHGENDAEHYNSKSTKMFVTNDKNVRANSRKTKIKNSIFSPQIQASGDKHERGMYPSIKITDMSNENFDS